MSSSSQSDTPSREVAMRVFATEFNDGVHTFQESDDDRAPVYQLLPTGDKANRVFFVGTLTEVEHVGEDGNTLRGRVVDPTGSIYVYAGQYQQKAERVLRDLEAPAYVSVVGKPRAFSPEDSDDVYISVRGETISEVDESVRRDWISDTADKTLERVQNADTESNPYARMAEENYETDFDQYVPSTITALEDVADGGSDGQSEAPPSP